MNIEDLLSPYRGFKPELEPIVVAQAARGVTPEVRGPALPSPESWEMFEFVESLTT